MAAVGQQASFDELYHIVQTARSKLHEQAAVPGGEIRLLVGHANLLDGLMVRLSTCVDKRSGLSSLPSVLEALEDNSDSESDGESSESESDEVDEEVFDTDTAEPELALTRCCSNRPCDPNGLGPQGATEVESGHVIKMSAGERSCGFYDVPDLVKQDERSDFDDGQVKAKEAIGVLACVARPLVDVLSKTLVPQAVDISLRPTVVVV